MDSRSLREPLQGFFAPTKWKIYAFAIMLFLEAIPYFYGTLFDVSGSFISFAIIMVLIGPPGAMAIGMSAFFPAINPTILLQLFTLLYAYIIACIAVWVAARYVSIAMPRKRK